MKFKPVLFASLAVAALGAATVLDTEGNLPFSSQVVHADSSDIVGIKKHDVKITLKQHPTLEKLDITATIDSLPRGVYSNSISSVFGFLKMLTLVNFINIFYQICRSLLMNCQFQESFIGIMII